MPHRPTAALARGLAATATALALTLGLAAAALAAAPGEIPKPPGANPDNRGWEKVSPDDKAGVDIRGGSIAPGEVTASESGDSAIFFASAAFAEPESSAFFNAVRATRGVDGWASRSVLPPFDSGGGVPNWAPYLYWVAPDHSWGIVSSNSELVPGAPHGYGVYGLYAQDMETGERTLLTPDGPDPTFFARRIYGLAASGDYRHAYFLSKYPLVPDADAPRGLSYKLYEVVDGETRLISRLTDGTPVEVASQDASDRGLVSEDLRRVFFIADDDGSDNGQLHVYQDGNATQVSPGDGDDRFYAANADGSKALYTTGTGGFDVLRLTNVETGATEELAPDVYSVVTASDDLERVYYLTEQAGQAGGVGDLWIWEMGATRHVATIPPNSSDPRDVLGSYTAASSGGASVSSVSPDGSVLAFVTRAQLTEYDNDNQPEVYRYDAEAGELACVSCPDAAGGTQPGLSELALRTDTGASVPPLSGLEGPTPWVENRNVSGDGERVLFQTSHALVPADVNGVTDVYEWRDGEASLVSSGTSPRPAWFKSASVDGSTALFVTRGQLVAADDDELLDAYAARAGGGFPEPAADAPCSGDGCRGSAAQSPAPGAIGSAVFERRAAPAPRPGRARLAVGRRRALRGVSGRIAVRVSQPGRILVRGRMLRGVRRAARKRGVHRIRVVLRRRARRALRRRGRVRMRARVVLVPWSGRRAARRVTLVFRRPASGSRADRAAIRGHERPRAPRAGRAR